MNEKKTKRNLAVIGDPIRHSLSPVMQNAGLKALNLDIEYTAIHVKAEDLPEFIKFAKNSLLGFNITVPHKRAIMEFLDEISTEARIAESVNTVYINENGRMYGTTTDGYGLETALKESFGTHIKDTVFSFIGCGGAIQAVACYFAEKRPAKLNFINRTVHKAERLKEKIKKFFPDIRVSVCSNTDNTKIRDFLNESSVVIQGTSLGLRSSDPPPIFPELLPKTICFYETIYKPTALLEYAKQHNIKYADGRTMLLHQGAKSLEIWTKKAPPVEAMRKALYAAMEK